MADNTSTTKKYLDYDGLVHLWGRIKEKFVKKTDLATTGTTGLVTGGTFTAESVKTGYSEAPIVNGKVYYANHEEITTTDKTATDNLTHGGTVVIPTITVGDNGHVTEITETTYTLPSEDPKNVKADAALEANQVVLGAGGKNVQTTGVTLGGTTLTDDATGTVLATETAVNTALTALKGEISNLENVMNLLGVVQLAEGATFDTSNNSVTIVDGASTKTVTAEDGDVVVCGNKEYLWSGSSWIEVGQVNTDEAVTALGGKKGDIALGNGLSITTEGNTNTLDVKLAETQGNVALDTSDGLKADITVTTGTEALAFGATTTIATVAGTEISVTMPADPTTDISALSTDDIDAAIDEAETPDTPEEGA